MAKIQIAKAQLGARVFRCQELSPRSQKKRCIVQTFPLESAYTNASEKLPSEVVINKSKIVECNFFTIP